MNMYSKEIKFAIHIANFTAKVEKKKKNYGEHKRGKSEGYPCYIAVWAVLLYSCASVIVFMCKCTRTMNAVYPSSN